MILTRAFSAPYLFSVVFGGLKKGKKGIVGFCLGVVGLWSFSVEH
jgi:hypothetical protein